MIQCLRLEAFNSTIQYRVHTVQYRSVRTVSRERADSRAELQQAGAVLYCIIILFDSSIILYCTVQYNSRIN